MFWNMFRVRETPILVYPSLMAYLLPLTPDGERTFSVVLGSNTYFLRSYYVRGQESAWLLDISDAGGSMLASGVKLVPGSPNCLAGYGDAFNGETIVVTLSRGRPGVEVAPGDTLNVLWKRSAKRSGLRGNDGRGKEKLHAEPSVPAAHRRHARPA